MNLTIKLLSLAITFCLGACRPPDPPLQIINIDPQLAPQVSIVSIQPTGATTAQLVVKVNGKLSGWQLSGASTNGQAITVAKNGESSIRSFDLVQHTVSGLVGNQTYDFRVRFRFDNRDSVTALRRYVHQTGGPTWSALATAPIEGGEYSAYPVAADQARQATTVSITRYVSDERMEGLVYYRDPNRWQTDQFALGIQREPRRSLIRYNLFFENIDRYSFYGLGYRLNEQAPDKYFYNRDLWYQSPGDGGIVFPSYGGETGEVAFFTTTDQAYFLTQNGSPAMRSINAIFSQAARAPLPESPGTLATFTINEVGYVVNQPFGQPAHLWAYNPKTDSWQRRADFPGPVRSRGAAFSVEGKGYFGLGTDPNQRGLRDLWQYDPATDRWQYVTEYPGQGNRYLAVLSAPRRAYVGWGYESQLTSTGAVRQVPCTDWWEFKP